jgi:hypothetical protein
MVVADCRQLAVPSKPLISIIKSRRNRRKSIGDSNGLFEQRIAGGTGSHAPLVLQAKSFARSRPAVLT